MCILGYSWQLFLRPDSPEELFTVTAITPLMQMVFQCQKGKFYASMQMSTDDLCREHIQLHITKTHYWQVSRNCTSWGQGTTFAQL